MKSKINIETSIITPIYNAEDFLEETLQSILEQTYTDWESILINDNSTDKSLEIAEKYVQRDPRFKIINKTESGGAAKARNAGIEAATGRFIAFLDSDDIWLPEKLAEQITFMKSKKIDFSYSSYHFISEAGAVAGNVMVPEQVNYNQLLKGNVVACLTAIYDTKNLGKVFMPDILKRQDFGLWLKITRGGVTGYGLQKPLAKYRLRTGSISHAKFNTMLYTWDLYRKVEGLSFVLSLRYIGSHLLIASIKRLKNQFKVFLQKN
ncbi:MAG: glycosyltransferase [Methylomarinum sp.]|nr:glycosyltransferase [Methylomarinum sp.]